MEYLGWGLSSEARSTNPNRKRTRDSKKYCSLLLPSQQTYWDLPVNVKYVFSTHVAIFFSVAMPAMFANMTMAQAMTASVPTWLREARSKKYSIISLYVAMSLADIPFEGTITLLWSVLNYWMIGYGYRSVSHFLAFT